MRVVALDDYQGLALEMGLTERLVSAGVDNGELVVLREHLELDSLVTALRMLREHDEKAAVTAPAGS
jgi:hypothetical protein